MTNSCLPNPTRSGDSFIKSWVWTQLVPSLRGAQNYDAWCARARVRVHFGLRVRVLVRALVRVRPCACALAHARLSVWDLRVCSFARLRARQLDEQTTALCHFAQRRCGWHLGDVSFERRPGCRAVRLECNTDFALLPRTHPARSRFDCTA